MTVTIIYGNRRDEQKTLKYVSQFIFQPNASVLFVSDNSAHTLTRPHSCRIQPSEGHKIMLFNALGVFVGESSSISIDLMTNEFAIVEKDGSAKELSFSNKCELHGWEQPI